ncbi:MAG: DNA primase [Patescibacteria group bacterium]|nr:DNA primase [Patescibacteria group bacterium]
MDSPVHEIKERLNIVDVIGSYVQLKKAGRSFVARCPFHKERTPSFHVSPERGTYKCFGCGEGGDIFTFIEKVEGIDFPTALKQLAERAGVQLPARGWQNTSPKEQEKEERLYAVLEKATSFYEEELGRHSNAKEYILSRGIQENTLKKWSIGYAPASWELLSLKLLATGFSKEELIEAGLSVPSEKKRGEVFDRFRGRIMFPIFNTEGKPIAFSGRFFEKVQGSREDGPPAKYVNSPETTLFRKSKVLYGLHIAKEYIRKADCILLVEGQFDVVLSHQAGLPFAVALSGTALTEEHLRLLGRLSKRLVLALDADEAGIRSGLKSTAMALAAGFDVKIPIIKEGKDPADLAAKDPELLRSAVRTSIAAIEFFLQALRPGAKDERGYKKLVEKEILPLIGALRSKIEQEHFIQLVAQRLLVSEDAVRAEMKKSASSVVQTDESQGDTRQAEDVQTGNMHVPLEKYAGMLLFRFNENSEIYKNLEISLGKERLLALKERLSPNAERLRFEFDILGEDENIQASLLLEEIARVLLDEEISSIQKLLRAAEVERKSTEAHELAVKLTSLARRREELRRS